jgi:XTP/dITP diphosphohydrolase
MVLMRHYKDPIPLIAEGHWHGSILPAKKGEHGFGYDSVFYVKEHNMSAAELDPRIKNTISHRAQALQQLKILFEQFQSELD